MVDLADRRVLRHEHAVTATEVGHVPEEDERARRLPSVDQRDHAHEHRGVLALDLLDDGQAAAHRGVDGGLVEADLAERHARRVRVDAQPVQRADRVRARVPHAAVGIDDDHPVTGPRRTLDLHLFAGERERALGDHRREPVVHLEVVALELAGPSTRGGGCLAREHRDLPSPVADGHGLHVHPLTTAEHLGLTVVALGVAPGPHERGPLHLVDDVADEVVHVERLTRGRTHLGEDHEPVAVLVRDRREQQQVGERQVGEQPPRHRQPFEMGELVGRQLGPQDRELGEGGHGRRVRVGSPGGAAAVGTRLRPPLGGRRDLQPR